jgi:ligand-binding sensor domain-containing protein
MEIKSIFYFTSLIICSAIILGFQSNILNKTEPEVRIVKSQPEVINSDSSRWTIYDVSNSDIPSNYIQTVTIDDSSNIWIGTESYGLAKFNGENWTVYNTDNSDLPSNIIHAIALDDSGFKWFGTSGGLAKFDGSRWEVYTRDNSGLPHNQVNSIFIQPNGTKWIGTRGTGLVSLKDTTWTNYGDPRWIVSLAFEPEFYLLWIGTYSWGMHLFNVGPDSVLESYYSWNSGLPDDSIRCIAVDGVGQKWIATDDHGLAMYDGYNWQVYNYTNCDIPSNQVEFVTVDNEGNKWIGMNFRGLVKYDNLEWINYCKANSGLPDDNVTCIAIDDIGKKWIGTRYGGLAVLEEVGTVGIHNDATDLNHIPKQFKLSQNYPNPFNPSTEISWQLAVGSHVDLSVYNTRGQKVALLVNKHQPAGHHQVEWDASGFASGLYYYRIEAGNFIQTRKMIYLK